MLKNLKKNPKNNIRNYTRKVFKIQINQSLEFYGFFNLLLEFFPSSRTITNEPGPIFQRLQYNLSQFLFQNACIMNNFNLFLQVFFLNFNFDSLHLG